MARHPTKEDILSAYRREALLSAAVRVFGERGFECATMERIADEADVAKGTTYLYYPSKQSIYDAALSHGFARLDERMRDALERAPSFRDAIASFIAARAEYFFANRGFFCMYVSAMARHVAGVKPRPARFETMLAQQTRRLEAMVARAVARREIRAVDAAATATAILDLTRGLIARRMLSDASGPLSDDIAFLSDLVWQGLSRAQGSRLRAQAGSGLKAQGSGHSAGGRKTT